MADSRNLIIEQLGKCLQNVRTMNQAHSSYFKIQSEVSMLYFHCNCPIIFSTESPHDLFNRDKTQFG